MVSKRYAFTSPCKTPAEVNFFCVILGRHTRANVQRKKRTQKRGRMTRLSRPPVVTRGRRTYL